ncbi:MAG: metal ABC transporter permease [Eubacteriales bacterium]
MLDLFLEMFTFPFMVRALLVGSLISLCASLLGVSLVLKRYSMIGDGLSHVGFGALALAAVLHTAPLRLAIPVVVAAAFLLLRMSENSRFKGDSAIAVISTSALAFGVLVLSLSGGVNTDVYNYMFGSIYAMDNSDVTLSLILCAAVLALFVLMYNRIFAVTFDEDFARAGGLHVNLYNMTIAALAAVTIVIGMRMMGAMLISALIIFPPLTSMRLFKTFRSVVISSAIVSVVCFFVGITASYMLDTPGGASVVLVNLGAMLLFSLIGSLRSALRRK